MKIELLNYTSNPELRIARAMRFSRNYNAMDEELTKERIESLIHKALKWHHLSVFEFADFTVAVNEISRIATHQLVRHRLFSFIEFSQRYSETNPSFVIPPSILKDNELKKYYSDIQSASRTFYKLMLKKGIPKEDARFGLLQSQKSSIIVKGNVREWYHFFKLRLDEAAQWEIRKFAFKTFNLFNQISPLLFNEDNLKYFD